MQNRDFYRHTEAEIIHHQQTHTTRNAKRNLLGGKEMIPDHWIWYIWIYKKE